MTSTKIRVAVIGAGAAGLCCARHLLSQPQTFDSPVLFEMSGGLGGTWVYSEGEANIHSSMYRDLRTNLPKEVMAFPDFPFDSSHPSFIHHTDVLRYLEEYADRFCIQPHIKFNCRVVSVLPVLGEGSNDKVPWNVTSYTKGDKGPVTQRYDAVMVCVGHYSRPFIPDIPGIETFQGRVLHSHFYRYPEAFSSSSVVVLGAGPSGVDIATELAPYAKQVTLSHKGPPFNWTLPDNMAFAPPVVRATPHILICEDGTHLKADTLIYCTGYKYHYPFLVYEEMQRILEGINESLKGIRSPLESEQGLETNGFQESETSYNKTECLLKPEMAILGLLEDDKLLLPDNGHGHLPPLYKHLFHARYPTMCFIGACKIVVPFPLFHCQALVFLSALEGKCKLPPSEQMSFESKEELNNYLKAGLPAKYLHRMEKRQWEYNRWLAEMGGFEPLPPVLDKLYEACHTFRKSDPSLYRSVKFEIINTDEFKIMSYGQLSSHDKDTDLNSSTPSTI
ncbi:uncharacterized protein LOC128663776 [Bombina bombina]|uniref:uncharacterized protein LOC128663776 n=1 Tax=Bombina bombina TaxID=8345 RepID=UPI00235AF9C3|nr:uncharacterized protein LOC128663776 [Bombina bombina]